MDIILHLGGNANRVEKTIEVYKEHPEAKIVISSEGAPQYIYDQLVGAGIDTKQFVFDFNAWDTVTNFTETFSFIEDRAPKNLYVVTDKFHMRRSMAIAKMVYLFEPISLIACPYMGGDTSRTEPFRLVLEDAGRSLVWKMSGYLIYDKKVKADRMPGIDGDKQYCLDQGFPLT